MKFKEEKYYLLLWLVCSACAGYFFLRVTPEGAAMAGFVGTFLYIILIGEIRDKARKIQRLQETIEELHKIS